MKIAIIGAGISGLVAAYKLHPQHDICIFEANDYVGGHTNTVAVESKGRHYSIDTGFIVFNDRTYPNFIALLEELGVSSQPTQMSFSVRCEKSGLEYRGADMDGLFAQRRNLVNPRFHRLLFDFLRFNRLAQDLIGPGSAETDETVSEFIGRHRLSRAFVQHYLLPMGSAIWSCPHERFLEFPIQFIAEFYHNHGLLSISNRPQWRVIKGGSHEYVKKLIAPFHDRIQLSTPVRRVERNTEGVVVVTEGRSASRFDHVVFACHSDQALRMLGTGATRTELDVLSAFPYERNIAVLHTQQDVLPKTRRAWASWNYFIPRVDRREATVTYNMNILQSLDAAETYCVTLNDEDRIRDENVIDTFVYHHPTFDTRRKSMQNRHHELINQNRTSFCGAYWGNGFHEDGVNSGLAVARRLAESSRRESELAYSS